MGHSRAGSVCSLQAGVRVLAGPPARVYNPQGANRSFLCVCLVRVLHTGAPVPSCPSLTAHMPSADFCSGVSARSVLKGYAGVCSGRRSSRSTSPSAAPRCELPGGLRRVGVPMVQGNAETKQSQGPSLQKPC